MNLRSATATVVLGGLALALVAALGWVLLLGPLTSEIGETRASVSDAEDRNLTLTSQLAVLQQQADDLSGTRAVAEDLDRLFPPTADQPGLFSALVSAAQGAGYRPQDITTLSPTAPVPVVEGVPVDPTAPAAQGVDASGAELAVQVVTLSVEGGFDQARRLLDRLERLDRAFLVQSVSVTGSTEDNGFTLSLTAATFLAPPLVAPAATG